jgi:heme-degrading monooxygenase HmoA
MYCTILRLRGDPAKTEKGIELWSREILPALKEQPGFVGATLTGNRQSDVVLSVSYWETEKAMKDGKARVRPNAMKSMAELGTSIVEEDECEVAVMERFQPPKAGAWGRLTSVQADPAHVEQGVTNFKTKIVPVLQRQHGARAAFSFVNRQTGKTFAGSLWETEQDLRASEAAIADLRTDAIKQIGGREAKTEVVEIYYTEILAPAVTGH